MVFIQLAVTAFAFLALFGQTSATEGYQRYQQKGYQRKFSKGWLDMAGSVTNLRVIRDASLTLCEAECTKDPECAAYTYINYVYQCDLKDDAGIGGGFSERDDLIAGLKTAATAHTGYQRKFSKGWLDTAGSVTNLRVIRHASLTLCEEECTRNPECAAYTYITSAFQCDLKDDAGIGGGFSERDDLIAGLKTAATAHTGYQRKPSKGWLNPAGGVTNLRVIRQVSLSTCEEECTKNPECTAYTYITSRLQCDLKDLAGIGGGFSERDDLIAGLKAAGFGYRRKYSKGWLNPAGRVANLKVIRHASLTLCEEECTKHPECAAYTYITSALQCDLKDDAGIGGGFSERDDLIAGKKTANTAQTGYQRKFSKGWLDTAGSVTNLRVIHQVSLTACEEECTKNPECTAYTYITCRLQCDLKDEEGIGGGFSERDDLIAGLKASFVGWTSAE